MRKSSPFLVNLWTASQHLRTRAKNPTFSKILLTSSQGFSSSSLPHHQQINNVNPSTEKYDSELYDKIIATLPRIQNQSHGRTFIDVWISQHNSKNSPPMHWPSFIAKCLELDRSMNKANFGGIFISFCMKNRSFQMAQNYMEWEKNPNLATLSGYLRIYSELQSPSSDPNYFPTILELYDKLKSKSGGVFDRQTGDKAIAAISKTKRWEECFEILNAIKIGGDPYPCTYESVVTASFNNSQFDTGWKYLHEIGHKTSAEEALITWLKKCDPPSEENMVKVLEYMNLYEHYPTSKLINEIQHYFETHLKYKGVSTTIIPSRGTKGGGGVCKNCLNPMERSILTPEEFDQLRDHFFKHVLVMSDIFINTTPSELEKYKTFIEQNSPYDYILDGLNIAFSCGKGPAAAWYDLRTKSPAFVLELFVSHLHRAGHKMLVIGRKHMEKWQQSYLNNIRRMADIYLIDDQSQDDPFLIWATFKSGMNAQFVSKDFMRNHTFNLKDYEMARLFKRWRLSHQKAPFIQIRGQGGGSIRLEPFTEIVPIIQKNEERGVWHVPYDLEKIDSPYDFPKRWMCFKRVSSKT